ncbi:MAG: TonB-dependent receptor [Flammeovirgaceae bacterium]
MKNYYKILLQFFVVSLFSFASYSQSRVSGVVVDATTNEPLIGANVSIKGTTEGTFTGLDGSFSFSASSAANTTVMVSYIGYEDIELSNSGELGTIKMISLNVSLDEVRVTADYGIDRKTPTTFTNVSTRYVEEYAGTQEVPELLKMIPGVYTTKEGGGVGDSRVYIRGFAQENITVMINGVPVNDMENGRVYWSNWNGLGDVTSAMQVVRGLGASKLAIGSIGGTINIITKSIDSKKGGSYLQQVSDYGQFKETISYNTGRMNNDWAISLLYSRTDGEGYVDGGYVHANTYFMSVTKEFNKNNSLVLTAIGAPQKHGQRDQYLTPDEVEKYGHKYNRDWGYYNGEVFSGRNNYYHKPHIVLNHYYNINENTSLNTSVYASYGKGGGSGPLGSTSRYYGNTDRTEDGLINWDAIVANNIANNGGSAKYGLNTNKGSSTILRNSVNNHRWYGVLTNLNHDFNDNLSLTVGLDARTYTGEHFREVRDLLGGDHWVEEYKYTVDYSRNSEKSSYGDGGMRDHLKYVNENSTSLFFTKTPVNQRIAYDNDGIHRYAGLHGQLEYSDSDDRVSAFVGGSVSRTQYVRVDRMNYAGVENGGQDPTSEKVNITGHNVKAGFNFNISDQSNLYINAGSFSRAPFFNFVFTNYQNVVVDPLENEKARSIELGYGFKSQKFAAKINGYMTKWIDKGLLSPRVTINGVATRSAIRNQNALHKGIELEWNTRLVPRLDVGGILSLGEYRWANDVVGEIRGDGEQTIETINIYSNNLYVGNHPQSQIGFTGRYQINSTLDIGGQYLYNAKLYSDYDVTSRDEQSSANRQPFQLDNYGVLDLRIGAKFNIGNIGAYAQVQGYNILDKIYWARGIESSGAVPTLEEGFPSWGRTLNFSLKLNF